MHITELVSKRGYLAEFIHLLNGYKEKPLNTRHLKTMKCIYYLEVSLSAIQR